VAEVCSFLPRIRIEPLSRVLANRGVCDGCVASCQRSGTSPSRLRSVFGERLSFWPGVHLHFTLFFRDAALERVAASRTLVHDPFRRHVKHVIVVSSRPEGRFVRTVAPFPILAPFLIHSQGTESGMWSVDGGALEGTGRCACLQFFPLFPTSVKTFGSALPTPIRSATVGLPRPRKKDHRKPPPASMATLFWRKRGGQWSTTRSAPFNG